MWWDKYAYFKGLKYADFKGWIKNLEGEGKTSSISYFRNAVTWRKAKVKVDRGNHWTRDNASPFFVPLCRGMPCRYLTKESSTVGSIFLAHVLCSNFKRHLYWIAAPTPLCLGPDQTLCDISRWFPRHAENLLGVMDLRKQSGSDIFNPDFHCWSGLPDWLHLRPALKQYMSLRLRWDVGTQTLVCPVWLQSATFLSATSLCTFCFSQSQGLGLALVPVVSRWKTVLRGYTFTAWPRDQWLKWMAD